MLGRPRPNEMSVFVTGKNITVQGKVASQGDRVWGVPDGTVNFVIENRDTVQHTVRIPAADFQPSTYYKVRATPEPLVAGQADSVVVKAGEQGTLALRLKPSTHFFTTRPPWNTPGNKDSMTYKFTIYTTPAGANQIALDPDLEVDR